MSAKFGVARLNQGSSFACNLRPEVAPEERIGHIKARSKYSFVAFNRNDF
jgi:hypothetical protein